MFGLGLLKFVVRVFRGLISFSDSERVLALFLDSLSA